ncbi:hypothetical protein Clacol_006149 [Clathrus columnatus]|uniref:Hydrophobin n=1 Tax=Clathrus columnatus TaxID=1419009 RepID=A0AAV5AB94_9AGAM|nr:hypothetical protein Clacol_006149 [Clathrus columnatus]
MLGLDAGTLTSSSGQVGVGCTAVAINGTAQGASCSQQPVCCQGNQFNGADFEIRSSMSFTATLREKV